MESKITKIEGNGRSLEVARSEGSLALQYFSHPVQSQKLLEELFSSDAYQFLMEDLDNE